jgi:hypothetical protein
VVAPGPIDAPAVPSLARLGLACDRPLVIVDVDEVLGLFLQGFGRFLEARGYEFRLNRFALFENIYAPAAQAHLDLAEGRGLFEEFFRVGCGDIEPAPGAIPALTALSRHAEILILSNAPASAERLRADWLKRHGLPRALILSTGPKGPITAALVAQTTGRTAFVDDLLSNLDSVSQHAPRTATFQHVADPRLRPLAPRSEAHRRIDEWEALGVAIEEALLAPHV